MAAIISSGDVVRDPAGADVTPIGADDVRRLQAVLDASGLPHVSLANRYSVVFVYPGIGTGDRYPELAGCTAELCSFADQTTEFVKHGIQLVGLSTQETHAPGDFLVAFPFPIGQLPVDAGKSLIEIVDKEDEAFATRRSFVVFPDGTGLLITNIQDPVAHVDKCFRAAIDQRLGEYQQAAAAYLQQGRAGVKSSMAHTGFLANGADSVSIATIDLHARVVAKMASAEIVSQEGGYMERVNRLLRDADEPPLFPAVIAIRSDQRPAYYLMEAANPLPMDHLVFADEAMTELRGDRLHLIDTAMTKLAKLHELMFRNEVPRVARYHYLDRFEGITQRRDFKDTYGFLFGNSVGVQALLTQQFVIDGDFVCRSFREQMDALRSNIDLLVQPVGTYLHGDVHLKNMLVSEDGRDVVFVDPRIVWDDHDVGDPGFGDPLYDFGTLLHSIHVMSTILRAIDSGDTGALMRVESDDVDGDPGVIVWPGLLRITGSRTVDWFTDWLQRSVPDAVLAAHWRARLHVNAANALFGWLKYARAVKTQQAWMAVFAATLYHLEAAARHVETAGKKSA